DRGTGTPTCAFAITSGFGVTATPKRDAVSVYGAQSVSDVRLASTVTSHTPSSAPSTGRLSGLPVEQPATGGAEQDVLAFESTPRPHGWKRRKRTWPVPGLSSGPDRSTLSTGSPAG